MNNRDSNDGDFSDNTLVGAQNAQDRHEGSLASTRKKVGPEDEKREALNGEPSAAQKVREDFIEAEDIEASEDLENQESSR